MFTKSSNWLTVTTEFCHLFGFSREILFPDDVEVSKTHRNAGIKYDTLGITELKTGKWTSLNTQLGIGQGQSHNMFSWHLYNSSNKWNLWENADCSRNLQTGREKPSSPTFNLATNEDEHKSNFTLTTASHRFHNTFVITAYRANVMPRLWQQRALCSSETDYSGGRCSVTRGHQAKGQH